MMMMKSMMMMILLLLVVSGGGVSSVGVESGNIVIKGVSRGGC